MVLILLLDLTPNGGDENNMSEDKTRRGDMPYRLGGWSKRKDLRDRYLDGEASMLKPDMRAVKALIDFATTIKRFDTEERMEDRMIGRCERDK